MRDAGDVVREFHERMQRRDWDGAAELLDPSVEIRFSGTGERFVGAAFLAMNRAYPDGWTIHMHEVIASGARVAAQVRVEQGADVFWCAGFYTVRDGRILDGVEHWVTERAEPAPGWRQVYASET
jgi:ketosteroid isomerase-like protein